MSECCSANIHCPKSNPNFRDIKRIVVENMILHEIFSVTFHVISRKMDFLWDSVDKTKILYLKHFDRRKEQC